MDTVALPLFAPKQVTSVKALIAAVPPGFAITVSVPVFGQPTASVTVYEYAPAVNPLAVGPVPPEGDQV
jgi:hypothetical protein